MQDTTKTNETSFLSQLWAAVAFTAITAVLCCGVYPLLIWAIAQGVFPHQANGSLLKADGSYAGKNDATVGSALIGQVFTHTGYFHPRPSAANNSAGATFSSTGGYDPTSSGGTNFGPLSDQLINGAQTVPATQPSTQPTTAPATQPAPVVAFDGIRLRTIHYAVDNGLKFKLFTGVAGKTQTEVPLKQYMDASGNLNDLALINAFPHPSVDPDGREVLTAGDFRRSDGTPVLIPVDAVTSSGSGLDPHISPENADLQAQRVAAARKITVQQVKDLIQQYTDGPGLGVLGEAGVNVLRLNLALDAKYPIAAVK